LSRQSVEGRRSKPKSIEGRARERRADVEGIGECRSQVKLSRAEKGKKSPTDTVMPLRGLSHPKFSADVGAFAFSLSLPFCHRHN
jgi:hypothetical protein